MNKVMRELGKLQTRKQIGFELSALREAGQALSPQDPRSGRNGGSAGLVDYKEITEARIKHQKTQRNRPSNAGSGEDSQSDASIMEEIQRYCSAGIPEDFLKGCPGE